MALAGTYDRQMEPQIRYCTTEDAVAIGSGPPLILSSPFTFSHVGLETQFPPARALYERLAAKHTLIRWDPRNYGLSQRGVDVGFSRWALDIEAVADKLGLERFDLVANPTDVTTTAHADDLEAVLDALVIDECDLFAAGDAGFAAIEFFARAAKRVGRLTLWGSYANRDSLLSSPKIKSMHALWD